MVMSSFITIFVCFTVPHIIDIITSYQRVFVSQVIIDILFSIYHFICRWMSERFIPHMMDAWALNGRASYFSRIPYI